MMDKAILPLKNPKSHGAISTKPRVSVTVLVEVQLQRERREDLFEVDTLQ
jgi:hypothetical protein